MRRAGPRRSGALMVALATAATASSCDGRNPREPAAAAPASSAIAFSYGGRIHAMGPDGSGRARQTGRRALAPGSGGDTDPAWSPDGARLAFTRTSVSLRPRVYLLEPGSRRSKPLSSPDRVAVSDPAWSPDGRQIAYVRRDSGRGSGSGSAIVLADIEGHAERVLARLPEGDDRQRLSEPAWSPDGARIAYTVTRLDDRFHFRPSLFVAGVHTGPPRLLARDADEPAWSPDGRRIAFASVRDRNGERCYDQCTYMGELYVSDADGSDPVRLTRNRGDDSSPTWSPDGRRIAFASDRNYPAGQSSEIYSIRPDGSCLTWLTNGAPGSSDPAWRPTEDGTTDPGRCGPTRRRPRVEVDTRAAGGSALSPAYWLGKRHGDALLTHVIAARDGPSFDYHDFIYGDCSRYRPRGCPPPLQLQNLSVCSRRSRLTVVDDPSYRPVRAFARHGVLFIDLGQEDLTVIAGAGDVRIFPGVGGRPGRRQILAAFRALRPVGGQAARLPAPRLPRGLLQRLRRTQQLRRRLGSAGAVARALGIPPAQARRRLHFARALRALPRGRTVDCAAR